MGNIRVTVIVKEPIHRVVVFLTTLLLSKVIKKKRGGELRHLINKHFQELL